MAPFDALIYPTVPVPAPTIEAAGASDSAYVALNLKLLRNPGLVRVRAKLRVRLRMRVRNSGPRTVTRSRTGILG